MECKNAIIGQSGGPTAAINATLAGVISGCISSPEIDCIYGMRHGIEGVLEGQTVLLNDLFADTGESAGIEATPAAHSAPAAQAARRPERAGDIPKNFCLFA